MLQYDLTDTRFFDAESQADLPGDAEMFVVTAALLLHHNVSFDSLSRHSLVFHEADLAGIAQCIEYRLPAFAPDIGEGLQLRERLRDFIGVAIGCDVSLTRRASSHPT